MKSLNALALGLAVASLLIANPARAEEEFLATAQAFGGVSGGRAVCYFTNLGGSAIKLRNFGIFSNGARVQMVVNGCGATTGIFLSGGRTCGIAAVTGDDIPYSCSVITDNKRETRGGFELRGPNPPQAIRASLALQ